MVHIFKIIGRQNTSAQEIVRVFQCEKYRLRNMDVFPLVHCTLKNRKRNFPTSGWKGTDHHTGDDRWMSGLIVQDM